MSEHKHIDQMSAKEFQDWLEMDPPHVEPSQEGDYSHIPIAYLEPDLRYTFCGDINFKVKELYIKDGQIFMIVRIKAFHPVLKKYLKYDGVAAMATFTHAGEYKGATRSLSGEEIKPEFAACYSEGIKNAAKKIGKRFGSDINRVNAPGKPNGKPPKEEVQKKAVDSRVQVLIDDCESIEDLNKVMPTLPNTEEVQKALNSKLKQLKSKKK